MSLNGVVNIEDLHQLAKKRLPKIAFDFIEGGVEDERGLETNRNAFAKHQLLPCYLVDVSKRDQSQTIFGRKFNSPFGISPTGTAGLFRRGADLMLAEAAREANIPYIQSGGSNDSMEAAAKVAPRNTWYQLYAARDGKISEDLVRRAADCGLEGLVLTVDVPVRPRRERNIRNGFAAIRGTWLKAALSLKPHILAEAMQHPGWIGNMSATAAHPISTTGSPTPSRAPRSTRSSTCLASTPRRTPRPGASSRPTASCSRAT
jgi:L-lactate dehydrogenase (cytochrome)/(S)-mandelate dehydrogenase